jgi:hypothetical protein
MMDELLIKIEKDVFMPCAYSISNYQAELEGTSYAASQFILNNNKIIYRNSKITPKKIGQFVTFWKRNPLGVTIPYNDIDAIDFFIITSKTEIHLGLFIFPKSVLVKKGIISTNKNNGKRGYRVYPVWDKPTSHQAKKTQ